MFEYLKGQLVTSAPDRAVVEVNGVGYLLIVPLSTYEQLPSPGEEFTILTHHYVREDEQSLYGFASEEERDLFRMLLGVSKIGPKVALGVLGGIPVSAFAGAIASGDIDLLSSVPGIGKKTAERLILELKDKIEIHPRLGIGPGKVPAGGGDQRAADVLRALQSLGYRPAQSRRALDRALDGADPAWPVERLLKETLKCL
ncbi:MAG: Holliday junction branch migration protein RuvA [Candidatus Erginobacter occultus]|nr:Holliday junction branch migration protein RuvA [Candidatus Erginobacter occultus]